MGRMEPLAATRRWPNTGRGRCQPGSDELPSHDATLSIRQSVEVNNSRPVNAHTESLKKEFKLTRRTVRLDHRPEFSGVRPLTILSGEPGLTDLTQPSSLRRSLRMPPSQRS